MRLAMFIPEFPTQTHVFFWREAQALRQLGVDVSFVSTRRPREACPHAFAREAAGQTHYIFPPSIRALLRNSWNWNAVKVLGYIESLASRGKRLARDVLLAASAADLAAFARVSSIDHIHVHSCGDAAHVVAMARLMGGPTYSLHLHGDLAVYGAHHAEKMAGALFIAAAARSMQQQIVRQVGVPLSKTVTLIMGVDTSLFHPTDVRPQTSPMHVVTVSRLNPAKGHHHALAALRLVLDTGASVTYSIVGAGPSRASIEADVDRLGLRSHVTLLGSLNESEIAELLSRAHVFLLPSVGIGEASPVAVMEAMASGMAVVCSRIGGTPDMISSGDDGFLTVPGDETGIADVLFRLFHDQELRHRLGQAAHHRAKNSFDSRVLARRLLDTIALHRNSSN
jgi:glycosyltransferase involved in cell wall biosynthesis